LVSVARALGVSPSTVSNPYNRPDQLSVALRKRVFETAAELGSPAPIRSHEACAAAGRKPVGVVFFERLPYAFADPAAVLFLRRVAEVFDERQLAVLQAQIDELKRQWRALRTQRSADGRFRMIWRETALTTYRSIRMGTAVDHCRPARSTASRRFRYLATLPTARRVLVLGRVDELRDAIRERRFRRMSAVRRE
jgi:hypothetical protein